MTGLCHRKLKMHTLEIIYSCYVTDSRLVSAGNYGIKESSVLRPEQFLTTVETTSRIKSEKTQLHISIDQNYDLNFDEFWNFIKKKTFQNLVGPRLESFAEWKQSSAEVTADCVLLMANHDHAFLQDDAELFQEFVDFISEQPIGCIGAITHWPEYMSTSKHFVTSKKIGGLPVLETKTNEVIGTVLIRRETFQSWFLEDFTKGTKFVRPDNPFGPSVELQNQTMYIPPFEFFRHLDGYGHIGISSNYASNLRPTIRVNAAGNITEMPWRRDLNDGPESFNPIQSERFDQGNRFPYSNPLLVLIKKSWGIGFYPKNFSTLLDPKKLTLRIYLAFWLILDLRFLTSLVASRFAWHKKKTEYRMRLMLSRIKSAII